MDGPRFDAWTRRRFGFMAGGFAASLWGAVVSDDAAAKKNKKKRCRKLQAACKPDGKQKCCGELRCRVTSANPGANTFCCKTAGKPCSEPRDCCGELDCCGGMGDEVCSSTCPSDRNLKTNFGSVDPGDMLERVRDLPIATWNYTADDASVRHIGPMAQDFAAVFGVGADDRHIHPLDGQGVALAAIQGLVARMEELREENARLSARVAAMESRE